MLKADLRLSSELSLLIWGESCFFCSKWYFFKLLVDPR